MTVRTTGSIIALVLIVWAGPGTAQVPPQGTPLAGEALCRDGIDNDGIHPTLCPTTGLRAGCEPSDPSDLAQPWYCDDGATQCEVLNTDWICPEAKATEWGCHDNGTGTFVCDVAPATLCVDYYCPIGGGDGCEDVGGTLVCTSNNAVACITAPWIDGDDPDCQCLGWLHGFAGSDPANPQTNYCTSQDTKVVVIGLGTQDDGCINTDDTVKIALRAQMDAGAQQRFELGLWIALSGSATARTGSICGRNILVPSSYIGDTCDWPTCSVVNGGAGPYRSEWDKKLTDIEDFCGDLFEESNNTTWPDDDLHPDAIYDLVDPTSGEFIYYEIDCTDAAIDSGGFVDIPTCVSWGPDAVQGKEDQTCDSLVEGGLTDQSSKCRCEDVESDVPAPNARMSCTAGTPTGDGDGDLEPGETVQHTIDVTNIVAGLCDPVSPGVTLDEERFACGTSSYIRVVIDFPDDRGDIIDASGTKLTGLWTTGDTSTGGNTGGQFYVVDDDDGPGQGQIIWAIRNHAGNGLLGVLGPDPATNPQLLYTFRMDTDDTSLAPINFDTAIWWSNDWPADFSDLSSAVEQSCIDCTCSSPTTTPVTLASFRALRESVTVTAEWATSTEVGTVGFNILGETPDGWARLNEEVIPAGGDTPHGRSYRANLVVPEEIDTFKLEEVDLRGGTRRHGPFAQDRFHGAVLDVAAVDWQAIRSQHDGTASQLAAVRPDRPVAKGGRSEVDIVDLLVREDGLYRVTYEKLAAAGFDLAAANLNRLGVTSRGQDVPISVYTPQRGSFGPGSWIEFYGEKLDSLYTDENVYRLRTDISQPARVSIDATAPQGDIVTTYTARRIVEENIGYSYSSTTGDPWYQQRMLAYSSPRSFTFPLEVTDLEDGPAKLLVHLFSVNGMPEEPDHHVVVKLNGVTVAEELWDGAVDLPLDVPLPPGALGEGANTLTVELPGDLGVWYDLVYLESYGASYPRRLLAEDGALSFVGRGEVLQVEGLDSLPAAVYRQDLGGLTRLTGFETIPARAGFTVRLPGTELGATYHLATESALRVPGMRAGRPAPEIGRGRAEYLIISHPAFLDAVRPLLLLRQEDGYSVQLVDAEDVYSEFGHGIFGADALRAYIEHAASRMGTEMVLLVGGDTYDYHDYLGTGSVSFLPSPYVATSEWVSYAPADASYADVDADGVPDIAIGRLPARTVSDAVAMVDKILDYETRSYPRTGVFAADTYDQDASQSFTAIADSYIRDLPAGWNAQRAYLDRMSVDQARSRLVAGINAGVALTVFVGHSGPASWTFLDLFDATDAANLTNIGRPTVVTQYGCWNTYYASPVYQHLAPALMAGDTGAAAVLGATALTDDANENLFGSVLMPRLVEPGMTMGEAILTSKQDLGAKAPEAIDILLGWNLLGDPGLVLER